MTTSSKEKFTVSGAELVEKVKKLVHEGNIRRVRIIYKDRVMLEMTLSIGAPAAAAGIVFAPILAAIGAFAALVTGGPIEGEKMEKPQKEEKPGKSAPCE